MQGCGCQQEEGVTPWNHRPNAPARVGSGSLVSEDQGVQRDGGVTAGCREVTDTWAMGDTGGLARGWEGEVGGGDPLPQGHGTPGPKAQWRAQQPLTGRTGDALEAGSTSQPTLVPTPVPPRAPTIPTPHHGLTCGFLGSKLAKLQRLDKVEGLQGAGQIRGHNKAPVPTVIGIKGHSHSTFFSSIAK